MSKVLILGDIHGRKDWKDAIEKENPDLVVFLGDYVSTHHLISEEEQIENLKEILTYKEENPDKVILLRGNHDVQHLGYYWAECSGYFPKVAHWMSEPENRERFLKDTQWIYIDEESKTIFAHAGISQVWIDETVQPYLVRKIGSQYDDGSIDTDIVLNHINDIEPCEVFGFIPTGWDMCGDSVTQSCVWIRPGHLAKCMIDGYTQVVGHTPVQRECIDAYQMTKDHQHLWLCDALNQRNYLVIEDREFKSKGLL